MLSAVDIVCPSDFKALINGQIRTVENPCGMFCNTPDMRAWKAVALYQIKTALLGRPDLPAHWRQWLQDRQAEIEAMSESVLSVGEDTRFFASIAKDADCMARWDGTGETPPVRPPIRPENPLEGLTNKILLLAGVGLAAWVVINARK